MISCYLLSQGICGFRTHIDTKSAMLSISQLDKKKHTSSAHAADERVLLAGRLKLLEVYRWIVLALSIISNF
jgi:hypothetical protein